VLIMLGALTNRMEIGLWILAIGPNITVIHRILHTWKQTQSAGLDAKPSAPSVGGKSTADTPHLRQNVALDVAAQSPALTRSVGGGRS